MNCIGEMSFDDVKEFLIENQLDSYSKVFRENKIDGRALLLLDDKNLQDLGVGAMGDRLKLLRFIHQSIQLESIGDEKVKVFNDPIHGHIEFHPLLIKIMDTPQFQRLRYLKQLGACYYVFPGASHNRFEHSIGVAHLAGELVKTLQQKQPELQITIKDIICVQIAGLCHDLGHGPFSHLFDGKFIPHVRPQCKWKHEIASVKMFQYLLDDNELYDEFHRYGLTEKDIKFIKEQIAGPRHDLKSEIWPYEGRDKSKSFLYEVVANKRNGIDVDKWDYFSRDCHMLGIKNSFDHQRFMKFARVLAVNKMLQICCRDKEVNNIYDMFHTRSALHRRAYQHKTNQIMEVMLTEALIEADPYLLISGTNGKMMKMSESIDDMVAYSKLTDYVTHQIKMSTDPNLKKSRDILEKIEKRKLYKCIGQTQSHINEIICRKRESTIPNEIAKALSIDELEEVEELKHIKQKAPLRAEDYLIHIAQFDYGMKDKNPLDNVWFYMKNDVNTPIQVRKDQVSQMLPDRFSEQYIRAYSKKTDEDSIEIARTCFSAWCIMNDMTIPKGGDLLAVELTPMKKRVSPPKHSNPTKAVKSLDFCEQ
ncbi:deoxynucleoside triphosphate triphosphohydrolase SAMHD1-like isoform X2 [Tubulanus polymorphus]|uniref:deoxynucleoside triphosphate triphosphohydrolase SAMHD1-like isoform X2 n=1 Tax=Tubulanus polymorphus TaxID=672921 RepID=UPI003DA504D7